jgi:hypothetical protein
VIERDKEHGIRSMIKKNASTGNLIERGSGVGGFSAAGN